MLSHTGVWIQWPLSLIVFIPDNSHVLHPCPASPSSTYSVNNEYFICFGDNESRGESEITLTLFCQFGKQFRYGRILNIFGGDHSPFCENENIHGFSIVKILYFLAPLWMFLREIWISIKMKKWILDYGMYS